MPQFKTIALIDDDVITNALNKLLLQEIGIAEKIVMIPSSVKALSFLTNEANEPTLHPLLILLDINMPVYNGFELLEKAQQNGFKKEEVTIMILSSSTHSKDIEKADTFELDGYLPKPLCINMLKQELDS